ncbi:MAG: hypothetical protein KAR20_24195, partial [Candidatus Heimdallarchaeota archaeon]|nr:hypothetical protein [Candidatus Heimdallarchaeota archaeon]
KESPQVSHLRDMAYFKGPDVNKLYVSNSAVDGTRQVQSGSLVVNTIRIEEYFEDFEGAWNSSSCFSDFYTFKPELDRTKKTDAPGKTLVTYQMEQPVITCEEAAVERGVPLEHELKTLIIQTSTERVAVHLCGDSSLSLRKVKNFLESSESYLVDPETLFELGMSAGTVSALLDPVWSMPHLISSRVLRLDYVTTNNGTRTGYFKFSPNLLLTAQNIQEGDFEK